MLELRRYATAAGLALLGREELGRHNILLDFFRAAVHGQVLSTDEVRKACDDHEQKQRRGQLSVLLQATHDTALGKLMRSHWDHEVGTEEYRTIEAEIEAVANRVRKRRPNERHRMRMNAFYVDVTEGGHWQTPSDLAPIACANEVQDTMNDYRGAVDRVLHLVYSQPEIAETMTQLGESPLQFPEPRLIPDDAWLEVKPKR